MEGAYPAIVGRRGTPVVVLTSGDPCCYGVGAGLARHVPPAEMRCFPQLSAFALATARLGWAQQDCSLLSLGGRPLETLVPAPRPGARILVLSADAGTPGQVARLPVARGFGTWTLTLLEAMGGPRERIRSAAADAFALDGIDPLNTMAVDVAGQGTALSLVPGRPDALFEHDGQITRADVRAATLARLARRPGEILWDVGAGSGSVAIEWMLADPGNRAFAIERHPERVARLRRNAATRAPRHADHAVDLGEGVSAPDLDRLGAGLGLRSATGAGQPVALRRPPRRLSRKLAGLSTILATIAGSDPRHAARP